MSKFNDCLKSLTEASRKEKYINVDNIDFATSDDHAKYVAEKAALKEKYRKLWKQRLKERRTEGK